MKRKRTSPQAVWQATPFTVLLLCASSATAAVTPEQQSQQIARALKGIPDQEWNDIAGEKITERYEVTRGDTLYDISGRLFGDTKYWPKIWELNNPRVLNPHFIYPRDTLTFQSGSGSSLPGLYVGDVAERTGGTDYELRATPGTNLLAEGPGPRWDAKTPKPRSEWTKLGRQPWEAIDIQLPPEVDRDGFDSRSYVKRPRTTGDELPYLMTCEKVEPAGYIDGSRSGNRYITMGNEVTIRPNISELEANQIYVTLGAPVALTNVDRKDRRRDLKDPRDALAYPISGRVRILGVNEGVYVGEVLNSQRELQRGDVIHSHVPRVRFNQNVNGPRPIQGRVFINPADTATLTGQFKWVFIDRGKNDGVGPGMIFRIFQYKDPLTGRNLSNLETLVQGDAQVYASCGTYSLAKVLWSRDGIDHGTAAILLTDVSEYRSRYYLNGNVLPSDMNAPMPDPEATPLPDLDAIEPPLGGGSEGLPADEFGTGATEPATPGTEEGDWLDQLDNGNDLSSDEARELNQLEKYEDAPAASAEPAEPAPEPLLDDGGLPPVDGSEGTILPPPPAEGIPDGELPTEAAPLPPLDEPAPAEDEVVL